MRIGIMIGEVRGPATADDLRAQAAAADGLAAVWSAQALGWDALTALVLAAGQTPTAELGTAVVPVRQRHPLTLAGQALSAQAATGNRLTLGIGAGIGAMLTGMYGLAADRPVAYLREYLSVLRPLLRGEQVEHHGEMITAVGTAAIPGTEPPPVLLAALGERMLRLAGEAADGTVTWMAGRRTLETHVVPLITAAAASPPRIVAGLPVTVTADVDDARERIARYYGMAARVPEYRATLDREGVAGPGDVALAGDESAVARQLGLLAEAGVTDFAAAPFGTVAEQARTVRLLRAVGAPGVPDNRV
ncbi:TIGR03564 family F420-dependent LLM class oxidoreductase [Actinoplanes sp. L3-i22]|uniref:TIGR03564 family F420-dependent LLM class oxidoreductase n=1 Tax=Actinoplanes sp. L3-i22 TaxID=2836373 RepID=UPI001C788632|nr:TIGR03564 family F420-dependent LLM class oxidoreductase [Actinoplanes sp. L3-i22]BCY10552.1 LLM class F420-dependent oxidoreductase [Actinoplanes sp. L3-i22]